MSSYFVKLFSSQALLKPWVAVDCFNIYISSFPHSLLFGL